MLRQRGVAPVSDSAAVWLREKHGASSSAGLLSLIASYRADKHTRKALRDKKASTRQRDRNEQEDISVHVTRQLLLEHGYPEDQIEAALAACGANIQRCVEHCLREVGDDAMSEDEDVAAETWASDLIQRLGFEATAATRALELSAFSFKDALVLLLNGNDIHRDRFVGKARFRRQAHARKVPSIKAADHDILRMDFEQRAVNELQKRVRMVDLGQYAGQTNGACFWLCLAAGLSRGSWKIDAQALPGLSEAVPLLQEVRAMNVHTLPLERIAQSSLGRFAEKIRLFMCAGPDAVLLRGDMKELLYAAFAALGQTDDRTIQQYTNWVGRLATREYADELVVLAVALELKVKIICVPHTPASAAGQWSISQYQPPGADLADDLAVVMGNNDLHYVWLDASL